MILKLVEYSLDGKHETVTFYDNIVAASSFYDAEKQCNFLSCTIKGEPSSIPFAIKKISYLCNDSGKTIEKLFPAIKK